MQTPDRVERVTTEPSSKLEARRTGVVFLCLIVATNFVPWMQLVEAGIGSTLLPSPAESSLVILSCLLAAALVGGTWLLGRRLPVKPWQSTTKARDAGLLLALVAAGANLALAVVLHRTVFGSSFAGELRWFGVVWFGLVLPTELIAAFFKGRASIPFSRLVPARSPSQPT